MQQLSTCDATRLHIPPPLSACTARSNLAQMGDATGSCERILQSPVPLSYTRHTARFLMLYLLFLPFAVRHPCIRLRPIMYRFSVSALVLFETPRSSCSVSSPCSSR